MNPETRTDLLVMAERLRQLLNSGVDIATADHNELTRAMNAIKQVAGNTGFRTGIPCDCGSDNARWYGSRTGRREYCCEPCAKTLMGAGVITAEDECHVCGIGSYLPSNVCDHCNVSREVALARLSVERNRR